ncbi:MAG: MBL fold metallo-hydrolase [Bacteroidales bacterium]
MPLFLTSLNSGSNGNCYYIGNEQHAVLVDAGLSCRETRKRLNRLNLDLENVRAVFISHEHSDHIRGTEVISRKYNIPVYISSGTYLNSKLDLDPDLLRTFNPNETIEIGGLSICAFPKLHDGADPYSFTISGDGITAGVFTDIGEACNNLTHHFGRCQAAFLEANYDEQMLENGHYPVFLKTRIRSKVGHLSNIQALNLFNYHRSPDLQLLVLSHLSQHNNDPDIVSGLFAPHANGTRIEIASRHKETEVFLIA